MSYFTGLKHGDVINNDRLREIFSCGNMGGMRRSLKTNTLVVISDHTKGLYEDKWIGDILLYTGMGKKGNQEINKDQNKTLNESNYNGVEVHLFEVFIRNNYKYRGVVKLVDEPYQEKQKGEDGLMRDVWIFPLKVIEDQSLNLVDKEVIIDNYEQMEKQTKRLSTDDLRRKALGSQSSKTSIRKTATKTYERNVYVSEYAKRRADGVCQLCDQPAPYCNEKGEPYLETHHIVWLSEGGPDTIENTVALCPNCHRKMHVLGDNEDIRKLRGCIK